MDEPIKGFVVPFGGMWTALLYRRQAMFMEHDTPTERHRKETHMDVPTVVANALTVNAGFIQMALDGLSDESLMQRPNDQCNPIGWTLWHQTRVEDAILSNISGKPQAWVEGGWSDKFDASADPGDIGIGHSLEQVMALKPTIEALKGYMAAVREKTLESLKALTPADLERELPTPDGGTRKVGDYLGIVMIDNFHHSGQVCYLRGYLTGKGWFPR
jgi:uncharacterized damage-inducible protein DinB